MNKKELKKIRRKEASKLLSILRKEKITFSDLLEYAKSEGSLKEVNKCILSI